ncbi:peptidyl-tRNA hydrolase [Tessaracoccus sp.]
MMGFNPKGNPVSQLELVQPIVIDRSATHEDAVISAALASVLAHYYADHTVADNPWEQWLSGPIAKTVRRAKPADWDRALNAVIPDELVNGLFDETERTRTGRAFALTPLTYEAMPAVVRRCQVAGTDLARTGNWPTANADLAHPALSINAGALMSTGKTAAQVSHALFTWYLQLSPAGRRTWVDAGTPVTVADLAPLPFAVARAVADVVIEDAGRTEIAPGTTTVVAVHIHTPTWKRAHHG